MIKTIATALTVAAAVLLAPTAQADTGRTGHSGKGQEHRSASDFARPVPPEVPQRILDAINRLFGIHH